MSTIQSIDRAFSILQIVSDQPDGVRLTDIIPQVNLPKSTVARILSTLENLGAVERHPTNSGYRIGTGILNLAMQPAYLVSLIEPYLHKLSDETNESIVLVFPQDDAIHFAKQIHSRHRLQVREWTGQRQKSLHADSAGKVVLANWPLVKRVQYLSRPLAQVAPKTFTDSKQLDEQLRHIRNQGYAWAYEELEVGLAGVSAPICDVNGTVVAAINITGPVFRLPPPEQNNEMTQLLVDTCQQIEEKLNHR